MSTSDEIGKVEPKRLTDAKLDTLRKDLAEKYGLFGCPEHHIHSLFCHIEWLTSTDDHKKFVDSVMDRHHEVEASNKRSKFFAEFIDDLNLSKLFNRWSEFRTDMNAANVSRWCSPCGQYRNADEFNPMSPKCCQCHDELGAVEETKDA